MTTAERASAVPATVRDAIVNRWRIARLVPRAGWGLVLTTGLCNLLLGALPVAFIVGTSVMLGSVPAAVAAGQDSPEWSAVVLAFVLASAAFAGQQALAPVQTGLGELIARRVDGQVFQRLLDGLGEASNELEQGFQSPGTACAGLLHLIARVVQLAGYLVVVGYVVVVGVAFSWLAGAGVLAAVLAFRQGHRGGLRRYSRGFRENAACAGGRHRPVPDPADRVARPDRRRIPGLRPL